MTGMGVTPYNQMPAWMMHPAMYGMEQQQMFAAHQFQQYSGFAGVQTGNPMLNMGLQGLGSIMTNAFGGTPLGINGIVGGNLHNNVRMQVFSRQHGEMMHRLGQANIQPIMGAISGLANSAGMDISDPAYQKRLGQISGFIGGNAHTADQWASSYGFHNLTDRLTSGRNLAGMASGIAMAGRNRYDPLTGRVGMSVTSAESVAQNLYNDLGYADGPNAWRRQTSGFGAGAMGDLFGEMSSRGLLSPVAGGVGKTGTVPGAGLDRQKKQLQDYTKALNAVSEIFGDAGIQNAPMQQLMSALENITQGGSYQVDLNRTNLSLRKMREAANEQGMGMSGAFRMMNAGQNYAEQLGLVATGVWTIPATTDAINFGRGLSASGALAIPGWGRSTPEQLMAQRQKLNLRNTASNIGNSMGALSRISQQFSGNEVLAGVVNDIKIGVTPTLGGNNFGDMSQAQVMQWVNETTGMSLGEVSEIFDQRTRNEEFTNELGGGASRAGFAGSRREFIHTLMGSKGGAMHHIASSAVTRAVGREAGSRELAAGLSGAAGEALLNMSSTVVADRRTRNADMGAQMAFQLETMAAGGNRSAQRYLSKLRGMGKPISESLASLGGSMYGSAEQYMSREGLIGPNQRNVDFLTGTAPDVREATLDFDVQSAFAAMAGAALAGGTMSPDIVSNAFKALQEAGQDPTVKSNFVDMFMTTLNIKKDSEMGKIAAGAMSRIHDAQMGVDEATAALAAETRPDYDPSSAGTREEQHSEWQRRRKEKEAILKAKGAVLTDAYGDWSEIANDPKHKGIKDAVDAAMEKAPGVDGEEMKAASIDIGVLNITAGEDFVMTITKPTVEVVESSGRKSGGLGGEMPPASRGGEIA